MSDREQVATPSQTVGPFFHFALADERLGAPADRFPAGEKIRLLVRVTDGDGLPVSDALVEAFHAGVFGRLPTGEDGTCVFETVRPGTVAGPSTDRSAPHLNICLFARGLLRQLHTRIYFEGDPALQDDPALALVPADRRGTLLATPDQTTAGRWVFDLRLQGPQETVFFDV